MNIAEVVAKMNVYLLNAADVCRKWLEPRLKSLEPNDWWNMIVLPSLSELQQKKVNEKGISTLQGLDLQAALTVARKNIYSFRNFECSACGLCALSVPPGSEDDPLGTSPYPRCG